MHRTGAIRISIFDHTIRRYAAGGATSGDRPMSEPVMRVHIDQSYSAARERVEYHLPDEAEQLLKGRFQIINVSTMIPP
jgi:hypothetical protein